jgi:hypothetical protein
MPKMIDVMLGVVDGSVRARPGEADLDRGEGVAIDDEGTSVGTPDAGMPELPADFERFDLILLIEAVHVITLALSRRREPRVFRVTCEAVHTVRFFLRTVLAPAGPAAVRMIQRRKAVKSRCSARKLR